MLEREMTTQQVANRGFRVFTAVWLGHVISLLGSELTSFALGVWVFQRTGSATQFTFVAMFAMLPGLLISPVSGALVDRWDRRWVLIVSDALAACVTLSIAGLLFTDQLEIWHIYLATMVSSVSSAFFQPAFMASTSLLVPPEQYGRANGMVQLGFSLSQIAAPTLAGVLVLTIELWGVLLIDFATFLVAITILLLVRIPRPNPVAEKDAEQNLLKQQISYGLAYITARPGLLGLIIFFAISNFNLGIVQILITPLILGFADAGALGQVLSIAGVGMLLGGIIMSIWGGPKRRVLGILGFTLLQGVILLLGGLQPNSLLIALAAAVFLFSSQIVIGCSQTIWQTKVAPGVQGRVFAIRTMIAWSSLPIAYFVAGPLADYVFEPLLVKGGPLSDSIGQIIGVGPGRGIGLLYIMLGLFTILTVVGGYLYPRLRLVELELPDATTQDEPHTAPEKDIPFETEEQTRLSVA
jgi:MFS family permease